MKKRPALPRRLLSVLLVLLLSALLGTSFASCGKDDEEVPVGLVVIYLGPDVTTTDHVFTHGDFSVLASYADGHDEYPDDFEFEQTGLEAGYYVFTFKCRGAETEAYVRCNVPVFPSDLNPAPEAEPAEP